jgi:hypothetical protein
MGQGGLRGGRRVGGLFGPARGSRLYQAIGRFQRAALSRFHGRLRESRRFVIEAEEIEARRGVTAAHYNASSMLATSETMLGGRGRNGRSDPRLGPGALSLDSMAPMARPYLRLASTYARAGAVAKAEGLIREYERVIPEVISRNDPERIQARGWCSWRQDGHTESIGLVPRLPRRDGLHGCAWLVRESGMRFDAMQQPDSAIATYEALATTPEAGTGGRETSLPGAFRRLGELYEARGRTARRLSSTTGSSWISGRTPIRTWQPRVADRGGSGLPS